MARNRGHVFGFDVDDRGNTSWILSKQRHGLHSRLYVDIQLNVQDSLIARRRKGSLFPVARTSDIIRLS